MFNFIKQDHSGELKYTKLYDVLGVPKKADIQQIKKAYKTLAMHHHPDRGGDSKEFEKISHAYEILYDEEKRKLYDKSGIENSDETQYNQDGGGFFNMFKQATRPSTENIIFPMEVTLDGLYDGDSRKLQVRVNRLCGTCSGTGGTGKSTHCSTCHGQGTTVQMKLLAPGMFQKLATNCSDCGGIGQEMSIKCPDCKGRGVKKQEKSITVLIHKGMVDGQKLVFSGESDEQVGKTTGDIVVVVNELKHRTYKRKGDNLYCDEHISLNEALCGFRKKIPFFKSKTLSISRTDKVTYPGEVVVVKNYGMPVFKENFKKGDLFIRMLVDFPCTMSANQQALIDRAFACATLSPIVEEGGGEDEDEDIIRVQIEPQKSDRSVKTQHSEHVEKERVDRPTNNSIGCPTQ